MSTIIGTIHLSPIHQRSRSIIRTTGPLFSPGTLQWVAAQSVHYATVPGDDAMRFAIGLAGLAFSKDAAA
ncbi:hypothetical protein [Paraburkholderia sediminicola]|uniref:hypothetical protein n=1 Tax=Paraburkholderia sediminicola TaxID=458836 RepID=UPI0038BC6CA0